MSAWKRIRRYGRSITMHSVIFNQKQISRKGDMVNITVPKLSKAVQCYLLQIARESLIATVKKTAMRIPAAQVDVPDEKYGCFVTLTRHGRLRGCIGYIEGIMPLSAAVIENAGSAAIHDTRFEPIAEKELPDICIEISVLTLPETIVYHDASDLLQQIVPGEDGIVLQKGSCRATFLPQVWTQLPDKIVFLEQLAAKAGLTPESWSSATIKRYRAQHFNE
jgi:uncharacterized protein